MEPVTVTDQDQEIRGNCSKNCVAPSRFLAPRPYGSRLWSKKKGGEANWVPPTDLQLSMLTSRVDKCLNVWRKEHKWLVIWNHVEGQLHDGSNHMQLKKKSFQVRLFVFRNILQSWRQVNNAWQIYDKYAGRRFHSRQRYSNRASSPLSSSSASKWQGFRS